MPDNETKLTPLQQVQGMFGVRSQGISPETARALLEHGEAATITPPATIPPATPPAVIPAQAGPQPSQDLLNRVKANQEAAAQESLQRILAARRAAAAAAQPAGVPAPTPLGATPTRQR